MFETKSDDAIYCEIAKSVIEEFGESEETDFITNEIFLAKRDSDKAVHCFFSPSKSNGWMACPAYLDRSKQWDGSKEPAIRGTIVHHFLSRAINLLKSGKYSKELDCITNLVFNNPKWISGAGVESTLELLKKVTELGVSNVESEVFLMSDVLGIPNKNLRFGGSIDVLGIKINGDVATVNIYDLKTGKNPVSPNCWQLKCYALLVQEFLIKTKKARTCNFMLGISQNGKLSEIQFSDPKEKESHFTKIAETMRIYENVYLKNHLNVGIDDCKDSEFEKCFSPCSYCRFCKGCFKREFL